MSTSYMRARVPYTYEEYRFFPDDGRRYELIDGELYLSPAPTPFHQTVSRRLQHALMLLLEDKGLAYIFNAPCDIIINEQSVVQPDLAIVRIDRKAIVSKRGIEGPPDIAVEILSPSNRSNDERVKLAAYARFGIPEYWIVDPELGWVDQHTLTAAGYGPARRFDRAATLISPTFAEIAIVLEPVFQPL